MGDARPQSAPMPPWPTLAGGIRRGWCRLFGRTKNTLMYALAVVVRNVGSPSPSKPKELTKLAAPPSDHASAIRSPDHWVRAGRPAPYRGARPPCLSDPTPRPRTPS